MNFNDLYEMVVEKLTIQPNPKDKFDQDLINRIPTSKYNLDKIVRWYRRDKESGVPQSELERIYTTKLNDMISTLVDYYTEDEKYRKRRGNDPRFLKNPFEQYRYSKGFFQNIDTIKHKIDELRDENRRLEKLAGKKKDESGEFVIRPEDETRIKLIDSSANVMVWSTEDFETTNRFIFNFWRNANMNVGYYDPTINSPYCTRIRSNWESYSKNSLIEPYQQIWFFLKPKGDYDYSTGDLTKPNVDELFDACNSQGPKLLLCMDDTAFDLLDRYDEDTNNGFGDNDYVNPVIDEVKKLDKRFRNKILAPINKIAQDNLVKKGEIPTRLKPLITRIEIPNGVTSIENCAFEGCIGLTSITIPDGVTSIGLWAFRNCSNLTSITIPDGVTNIEDYAFSGCCRLTSVTMPSSLTSIGKYAFSGCFGLTSVTIPDNVTSIGNNAFSWCSGLTSVTIPDSVTHIGENVFSGCDDLTNVTIPDGVTSIELGTFSDCSSLKNITIPDSVTSIGGWAFFGCRALTNITIPDSVTSIGEYAFGSCSSLTSIKIPDSVTSIGKRAFYGCEKLIIQTTPIVAKMLKFGFDGDIKIISDKKNVSDENLMREFVETLRNFDIL